MTFTNDFQCLTTIGDTIVACDYNDGLYYSKNKGKTWRQSNITCGNFRCLTVINNTVIANVDDTFFYSEDKGKTWHYSRIIKYDENEDNTILNSLRDKLLSISNEVNNYVNLEKKVVNNDEYITYIHRQIKDIITKYQFSENKNVKSILNELLKLF